MKSIHSKTFMHALCHHRTDPRALNRFRADRRLTQTEKKILECWTYLASNQFIKILSILESLPNSQDPLVEAQKKLILGITLNNKSESRLAIDLIRTSYDVIRDYPVEENRFTAISNLFIAYLNYKDEVGMEFALLEMERMDLRTDRRRLFHLHCRFNYHAFRGELDSARSFLEEAARSKDQLSDVLAVGHEVNWFVLHVKSGDFKKCYEVLEEMKKFRKFYHSENYNYMKMMLDHYLHHEPLYVYATDFPDQAVLYEQLRVIKFLEEDDRIGAQKSWDELQRKAPHLYHDGFEYRGDLSIFSLCLSKHLSQRRSEISVKHLPRCKEERLIFILKSLQAPVNKEILYEKIWNEPPQDKNDVMKLKKLVSRCREKWGAEIQYRKGCYLWVGESSQKIA